MRKTLYKPWAVLCMAALLTACGGSDGEDKTTPTPTAAITAVQTTVEVGQIVQLSGEGSRSPNNGYLTYGWSISQKPQLSSAEILQQDQPTTTFHADIPGTYIVSLTVINDSKVLSTPATLTITAVSTLPVAVAEKEVFRQLNRKIELDGSNSTAPDGGSSHALMYEWALSAPSGVTVPVLDDAYTAWPSFTATAEGMYIATLTVTHDEKVSKPLKTYIMVTKGNAAPNARITLVSPVDAPYYRDQVISLSAATSDDDDGDELQYRWRFAAAYGTARPLGSEATLVGVNDETVSFTPDVAGIYWVQLDVFDGQTTTTTQRNINVIIPEGTASQLPKILGISVTQEFGNSTGVTEMEIGAPYYLYIDAYDPDGGAIGYKWEVEEPPAGWRVKNRSVFTNQTFQELVDARTGSLYGGTNFAPTGSNYVGNDGGFSLVPPSDFQYSGPIDLKIKVTLYDAQNPDPAATGNSVTEELTLRLITGANLKPKAFAGTNFTQVLAGSEILLNGGFEDGNGNAITDWQWELLEKPQGSNATIVNPKVQNTAFIADKVGNYRLSLVVTDSLGAKSDAPFNTPNREGFVTVTAKPFAGGNGIPTARFTKLEVLQMPPYIGYWGNKELEFDIDESVYHYQLGSIKDLGCTTWSEKYTSCVDNVKIYFKTYDPDGDALIYDVLLEQPAGAEYQNSYTNKVASSDGSASISLLDIKVPGDYKLTLQALDGIAVSSPQYLTLRVSDFPADYKAFKVHYCHDMLNGNCSVGTDGSAATNMTFLPNNGHGSEGGRNATDRYETFANGGTVDYYVFEAIGQDYTLEDITTWVSLIATNNELLYREEGPDSLPTNPPVNSDFVPALADEYRPRFINLPTDNIIKAGEKRVIGLHIPKMQPRYKSDLHVDYSWHFKLKEERNEVREDYYRPGYFMHYEQFTVPRLVD